MTCPKRRNTGHLMVWRASSLWSARSAQGRGRQSRIAPARPDAPCAGVAQLTEEAPGQGDIRAPQLMQRSGGVDCCRATIVATESETIDVHPSTYFVRKSIHAPRNRKSSTTARASAWNHGSGRAFHSRHAERMPIRVAQNSGRLAQITIHFLSAPHDSVGRKPLANPPERRESRHMLAP